MLSWLGSIPLRGGGKQSRILTDERQDLVRALGIALVPGSLPINPQLREPLAVVFGKSQPRPAAGAGTTGYIIDLPTHQLLVPGFDACDLAIFHELVFHRVLGTGLET